MLKEDLEKLGIEAFSILISILIGLALFGFMGLLAKLKLMPYLFILLGIALVFALGKGLRNRMGARPFSVLVILVAAALSIAAVIGRTSVWFCFLASSCWAVGLFSAKFAFPRPGRGSTLIRSGLRVAFILSVVTGGLWVLSFYLGKYPPDHILDWGIRLERLTENLEMLKDISTGLLLLLILAYFLLVYKRGKTGWIRQPWRWTNLSRQVLEGASTVLVTIAAFSFTAGGTSDGLVQQLTDIQARALSNYTDIVWKIELSLAAHIRFQISEQLYEDSPPSTKRASEIETKLYLDNIPSQYYTPGYSGMKAKEFLEWKDPRVDERAALLKMVDDAQKRGRNTTAKVTPPPGTALAEVDGIKSEAEGLAQEEAKNLPPWITGMGSDVIEKIVELSVSSDYVPVLRNVGKHFPLASEILGVAFGSIDEALAENVKAIAVRVARDRARGKVSSLKEALRSAEEAIRAQVPRRLLSKPRLLELEQLTLANQAIAESAENRFKRDLKAETDSEVNAVHLAIERYKKIAGPNSSSVDLTAPLQSKTWESLAGQEGTRLLQLLNANEVSIDKLRAERMALDFADRTIGEYVISHPLQSPEFREVLGKDYRHYQDIGIRGRGETYLQRVQEMRRYEERNETREVEHIAP